MRGRVAFLPAITPVVGILDFAAKRHNASHRYIKPYCESIVLHYYSSREIVTPVPRLFSVLLSLSVCMDAWGPACMGRTGCLTSHPERSKKFALHYLAI